MSSALLIDQVVEVLHRSGRSISVDQIRMAVKALYGVQAPTFQDTAKVVFGIAKRWIRRDSRHEFSVSKESWGDYLLAVRYPELAD